MVVVIYITKVVNTKPLHGIQTGSPLVVTLGQQSIMSGRSPPLNCILITMRSHQSYHNITTVIHSYEYSTTVDNSTDNSNSTIETYRNRGLGK